MFGNVQRVAVVVERLVWEGCQNVEQSQIAVEVEEQPVLLVS